MISPINIFEYYQAYKPMNLNWSNMSDIKIKVIYSKNNFI